ncbi:MAG TPA: histidine phosphatase family protein [Chloroflexi bacterium]|nr:histidine phosphatase family protein [Chloroflexota bacterium]
MGQQVGPQMASHKPLCSGDQRAHRTSSLLTSAIIPHYGKGCKPRLTPTPVGGTKRGIYRQERKGGRMAITQSPGHPVTHILLIRHGQTQWNREARFRGQTDIPLDETGQRQAQATAEYVVARWAPTAIYASPLRRAMQTAEAIASLQGLTVQPLDGLMDIHFGELQGMAFAEARERYPDLMLAWRDAPHTVQFPGGESLEVVRRRGTAALRQVAERHLGQTIALVAHTVVNQVLLCAVLGLGNDHFWSVRQDTCAVNVIEWHGEERYRLALMNDTSHLWRMK